MADYLPKFLPGQAVTFTAAVAVTGGRLVDVTAARAVSPAGAGSAAVVGVAGFDADPGEPVTVFPRPAGIHRLTAAAAVAAGAKVSAAAGGKIATAGANPLGIALQAAAADGDVIDVMFLNL